MNAAPLSGTPAFTTSRFGFENGLNALTILDGLASDPSFRDSAPEGGGPSPVSKYQTVPVDIHAKQVTGKRFGLFPIKEELAISNVKIPSGIDVKKHGLSSGYLERELKDKTLASGMTVDSIWELTDVDVAAKSVTVDWKKIDEAVNPYASGEITGPFQPTWQTGAVEFIGKGMVGAFNAVVGVPLLLGVTLFGSGLIMGTYAVKVAMSKFGLGSAFLMGVAGTMATNDIVNGAYWSGYTLGGFAALGALGGLARSVSAIAKKINE